MGTKLRFNIRQRNSRRLSWALAAAFQLLLTPAVYAAGSADPRILINNQSDAYLDGLAQPVVAIPSQMQPAPVDGAPELTLGIKKHNKISGGGFTGDHQEAGAETAKEETGSSASAKTAENNEKDSKTSEHSDLQGRVGLNAGGSTDRRPRIGLALGGGGTRGLAHISVIRVLEDNGIPIDCVAGTSMGAIVGGLYCSGMSPRNIEKVMREKAFVRSYDTVPIPVRVSLVPLFFVPHLFGYHPYDGLYRGNKFCNFINEQLGSCAHKNIEDLKKPFCAVASDLLEGKPYAICKGNVGRALQASSAIPELRRPVYWQDKLLVDGGVNANMPVTQCRALGADIVIAVDVDERLDTLHERHFHKIGSVPYRCLNMHLETVDRTELAKADLIIHPNVNGIEILSSRIKDMNGALDEGEIAAKKAIPVIKDIISKKMANTNPEGGL